MVKDALTLIACLGLLMVAGLIVEVRRMWRRMRMSCGPIALWAAFLLGWAGCAVVWWCSLRRW